MASVSTPEFWSDLYTRRNDRWELRQATPPLAEFVEHTPPAPGRVAVPGCGRGHDVRFLAGGGHAVVGFDFFARGGRRCADPGARRGGPRPTPCGHDRDKSGPSSFAGPTSPRERGRDDRVLRYGEREQDIDA
jgi:hypothetical protein